MSFLVSAINKKYLEEVIHRKGLVFFNRLHNGYFLYSGVYQEVISFYYFYVNTYCYGLDQCIQQWGLWKVKLHSTPQPHQEFIEECAVTWPGNLHSWRQLLSSLHLLADVGGCGLLHYSSTLETTNHKLSLRKLEAKQTSSCLKVVELDIFFFPVTGKWPRTDYCSGIMTMTLSDHVVQKP